MTLVIIGPNWLQSKDENGQLRLEDPNDFVRLEVEMALRKKMPVIPVLVSNARMPKASELPASMSALVTRNGTPVRPDPDFNNDMTRLFAGLDLLEKHLAPKSNKPASARTASPAIPSPRAPEEKPAPQPAGPEPQKPPRLSQKSWIEADGSATADPAVTSPKAPMKTPRFSPRTWLLMGLALVGVLTATGISWHYSTRPGPDLPDQPSLGTLVIGEHEKPGDVDAVAQFDLSGTVWEDKDWVPDRKFVKPRQVIFEENGTVSYSLGTLAMEKKAGKAAPPTFEFTSTTLENAAPPTDELTLAMEQDKEKKEPPTNEFIKNRGTWKLEGSNKVHCTLDAWKSFQGKTFRGTVVDADTIVGTAVYDADGSEAAVTLHRHKVEDDISLARWAKLPGTSGAIAQPDERPIFRFKADQSGMMQIKALHDADKDGGNNVDFWVSCISANNGEKFQAAQRSIVKQVDAGTTYFVRVSSAPSVPPPCVRAVSR